MAIQSSLKKIFNNSLILMTGNIGASLFSLLSIAVFTQTMGAEVFGYYVLFLAYIEIVDRIFNFQTWQAFIKYSTDFQIKGDNHNISMLLKYSFIIDFVSLSLAFSVAYIGSPSFVQFFQIPVEYTGLILLLTFLIIFNVLNISVGVFRLYGEFRVQSKILVFVACLKFLGFCVVAVVSPTFEYFVYVTIFVGFITMLLNYIHMKKVLNKNNIKIFDILREKINHKLLKEINVLSFIVYNNFDVAVRMISRQLDVVILAKISGAEIVGIYRIVKEISNIIARLVDPIYQAVYPEIASLLARKKGEEAKSVVVRVSIICGGAGIVFYCIFIFMGEFFIGAFFGKEFVGAYEVVLVYFFAIFIAIISLPLVPVLHAKGLAKKAFINQVIATGVYLLIIYPFILEYAEIGASAAYIVFYMVWLGLTLKAIRRNKVFL